MKNYMDIFHTCPKIENPLRLEYDKDDIVSNELATTVKDSEGYSYTFMTQTIEAIISWTEPDENH
jgi:hypothetical protein